MSYRTTTIIISKCVICNRIFKGCGKILKIHMRLKHAITKPSKVINTAGYTSKYNIHQRLDKLETRRFGVKLNAVSCT